MKNETKQKRDDVWKGVDWEKTATQIAREVGRDVSTVRAAARERLIELNKGKPGPALKADYSKVDWDKPLAPQAKALGVSRQTLLNRRPAGHKPAAARPQAAE